MLTPAKSWLGSAPKICEPLLFCQPLRPDSHVADLHAPDEDERLRFSDTVILKCSSRVAATGAASPRLTETKRDPKTPPADAQFSGAYPVVQTAARTSSRIFFIAQTFFAQCVDSVRNEGGGVLPQEEEGLGFCGAELTVRERVLRRAPEIRRPRPQADEWECDECRGDSESFFFLQQSVVFGTTSAHRRHFCHIENLSTIPPASSYMNSAGQLVMEAADPAIVMFKDGLELRLSEFKEDCKRVQQIEQRLQEKIEAATTEYEHTVQQVSNVADARILKRLREQQRLIDVQQAEIDQIRHEKNCLQAETRRLRELTRFGHYTEGAAFRRVKDEGGVGGNYPNAHVTYQATVPASDVPWANAASGGAAGGKHVALHPP